jgi:nitrile hydratase accessory protein
MRPEILADPVYSEALDAQIFDTPAQASLFALTIDASRRGLFSWTEWVERFSANGRVRPQADGLDAYFSVWIDTLGELIAEKAGIQSPEVQAMAEHWRRSFLATPHGEPIELCRTLQEPPHIHDHTDPHHHHHHVGTMPLPKPVFVDPAR